MDCPTFQARKTLMKDELKPYVCPLIYCMPDIDAQSPGNFTFSICVKSIQDFGTYNLTIIEKICKTDYNLCKTSCGYLKGDSIDYVMSSRGIYNTTYYTAVGCIEGDHTGARNKSSVFPPSSLVQRTIFPHVSSDSNVLIPAPAPAPSSSNQLYISMMIPWILIVTLFFTYFVKKN